MRLGTYRSGVSKPMAHAVTKRRAWKASPEWELANLYYEEVLDEKQVFESSSKPVTTDVSVASSKV